MLVDRWSAGDPNKAGRAYAINVLGCILGPLLSGFILLPFCGEHLSMLIYSLPWIVMALIPYGTVQSGLKTRIAGCAIAVLSIAVFFVTENFETIYPQREVLRDSTATVIATGSGMGSKLFTNGIGMTRPTPITKMMAHLTFSTLSDPPHKVLIICFGMGTTYRSAISWGVQTTAVELVPSVPRFFSYFHHDADQIRNRAGSHVVIDDGRRYLERTSDRFDAILLDPPPPVSASASSLLYSEEFYVLAKQRLQPGGILQQWLPGGDKEDQAAVAKALKESFRYVKVYKSIEGWGWHFLASMQPIPDRSASELVARMPASAVADLMEWGPKATPVEEFQAVLSTKTSLDGLIAKAPNTPALSDDRPINEYFLSRTLESAKKASTAQ
jgi:spermidine synthase